MKTLILLFALALSAEAQTVIPLPSPYAPGPGPDLSQYHQTFSFDASTASSANYPNYPFLAPGLGYSPAPTNNGVTTTTGNVFTEHPPGGSFSNAYMSGPGETEKNDNGQTVNTPSPFLLYNEYDPASKVNKQHLRLIAYADPNICHLRTGYLQTVDGNGNGFSQLLGYFEFRVWMPQGYPNPIGQGNWPAVWLQDQVALLTHPRSTNAAEVDIAELYGTQPNSTQGDWMRTMHTHLHIWSPSGVDSPSYTGITGLPADPNTGESIATTGWHTYGCLVNADLIHFYFDGNEVFNCPSTAETAQHPLYPSIDMGMGGGWPTDLVHSQVMKLSYIKVWAHN